MVVGGQPLKGGWPRGGRVSCKDWHSCCVYLKRMIVADG